MKPLVIKATESIRKKVYKYLRDRILKEGFAAGERLVETSIAKEIGTSRTPVREALHTLEREGLIESRPRIGYVTKRVSVEEVKEICEIRYVIETLAAKWAINKARNKLIHDLANNIRESEKRLRQGKAIDFVDFDGQFHEIIAKCAGSERLMELAQTLRIHMLRYRVQTIYKADNVREAIQGHKEVLAAIKSGDTEQIDHAIKSHLEISLEAVIRIGFPETTQREPRGE